MGCHSVVAIYLCLLLSNYVSAFVANIPSTTVPQTQTVPCCSDGWVAFSGSCYYFGHKQMMTFHNAKRYCAQHESHLAHVETAAEGAFLREYVARFVDPYFWIGLTDEAKEGVWRWSDDNTPVTYTDWASGQPDDYYSSEDCVAISYYKFTHRWTDIHCQTLNVQPLCELKPSAGPSMVG